MDIGTICGDHEGQDSTYAVWYPRVVTVAHRLVARKNLNWGARSSDFLLLLKRGCEAAESTLASIRVQAPAVWRELSPRRRVNVAVRIAAHAMALHVKSQGSAS